MHQQRQRRSAPMDAPAKSRPATSVLERLMNRVVRTTGGCWEWQGFRQSSGHGQMGGEGGNILVHRAAWESLRGPIPEGMVLDHLCENPPCVNPAHLEVVTHAENTRRHRRRHPAPDVCTACGARDWVPNNGGASRRCRECDRRRKRARSAARRPDSIACAVCGDAFTPSRVDAVVCSPECRKVRVAERIRDWKRAHR